MRQADVTDLPFEDATFTLMFGQHVQMNVADESLSYEAARRGPVTRPSRTAPRGRRSALAFSLADWPAVTATDQWTASTS